MSARYCQSEGLFHGLVSGLIAATICIWAVPTSAQELSQSATDLQGPPAHLPTAPAAPLDPLTESVPTTRVTVPPLEVQEASPAPEPAETADAPPPPPTASPAPEPATAGSEPLDPSTNPLITPPAPSLTSRWPDPIPFGQPLPR
ncbi:hypothetical protein IQ241_05895 [Romeria aff. gracilis LEGE 07310]|uniref:Uncharacterized protein n=1 Tax=Vasconcelosia minhoensis LEGE 07310 TaxID=915328 RepID=A0A8J7AKG8_9CYAN|nr:hypothetical protein [Romeria gracilis]MBE9076830.1 hypothetical protein [Romeria aff. gracilis LEGE 07310]